MRLCFAIRQIVFVSQAAQSGLHFLEEEDREHLRKIVEENGLSKAARLLNISRGVISSTCGGIGVRRGSLEMLREALLKHRGGAK